MKIGKTKVRVFRRETNEQTGKTMVKEIHRGIVVQVGSSFARVFNPAPQNEGGDASQLSAEQFPIKGRNCWIELTGETDESIRIAAELR
jgi:hypothetical protein